LKLIGAFLQLFFINALIAFRVRIKSNIIIIRGGGAGGDGAGAGGRRRRRRKSRLLFNIQNNERYITGEYARDANSGH